MHAQAVRSLMRDRIAQHRQEHAVPTNLKPGDTAPAFALENDHGETVKLEDLRGKYVVLYWYPKDDTPGCTTEACEIRDSW